MKILIVDDEPGVRRMLSDILIGVGYKVFESEDGADALEKFTALEPDLVLLDIKMPKMDGLACLSRMLKVRPSSAIIVMTAFGTTELAIRAIKEGAYDYVVKPFNIPELLIGIERAMKTITLTSELVSLKEELASHSVLEPGTDGMVGNSQVMQEVYKSIGRISSSDCTVLIMGETGTGKELVAKEIHRNSLRTSGPFIKVNCAAIPEALLESEMFGHEKGAFTGAVARRIGRFEMADKGTILLDEIGEMPLSLQAKLLRVLQEREFERLGSSSMVKVDVRVIASTNRDLIKSISEGTFREDLFYRLNVYPIRIPPLRDRKEDIPEIAEVYLMKLSARNGGRGASSISPEALKILMSYDWPGNVRELQNVIEQSAISAKGIVLPEDLPSSITASDSGEDAIHKYQFNLKSIVQDVERQTIIRALNHCNWNKSKAADLLGLGRRTLYDKMRDLGIGVE